MALIWYVRIHRSRLSATNQSQGECLRSVSHSRVHAAGCPPPSHSVYRAVPALTLVRYSQAQTQNVNMAENRQNNGAKKCPTIAHVKGKKKKSDEKKQRKKKELDRAREKMRMNTGESFQRWRELRDLEGLFCWTSKEPCLINVSLYFLTTRLWWRRLQ